MTREEKLKFIQYCSYKFSNKKFSASETKDFFDLEFTKLVLDNIDKINNSQVEILAYFDFSQIFDNFNNGITEIQDMLLRFMIIKGVKGINDLLVNMDDKQEEEYLTDLYMDLSSKVKKTSLFTNIVNSIKHRDKLHFIINSIDLLGDDEIIYLVQDLYLSNNDDILRELAQEERISDVIIKRVNAPFFYEMVDNLELSNRILDERANILRDIIARHQGYDVSDIKNAYCELYFHDIARNVYLDIKTILDLAHDDSSFRYEYLGDIYDILVKIEKFLNSSEVDHEVLDTNIGINQEVLSRALIMCQKRFKELVVESILVDPTSNIKPQELASSSGGLVKLYNIENQSDRQEHFTMLVSTIPVSGSPQEFMEKYYSNKNSEVKHNRRSCSLINETKLTSLFGGSNRIIFGFNDLDGRNITSATLGDGRTDGNEFRFRRKRKVVKSDYYTVDKFISETQGHNEVTVNMGDRNNIMIPSYILVTDRPTQFEIDVANLFQVPIRYVNVNNYRQAPDKDYMSLDYDYYQFQKREIVKLGKEIKR